MILDLSSFQGSKSKIISPLLIDLVAPLVIGLPMPKKPALWVGSDMADLGCADTTGVSLAHITGLEQVFV